MFIPPQFRLFVIGLWALITWKFLTLGAILFGAAILAMIDVMPESPTLLAMGCFFTYVGLMAFQRLQNALERPTL